MSICKGFSGIKHFAIEGFSQECFLEAEAELISPKSHLTGQKWKLMVTVTSVS
jgi:hypothetical protein